MRLSEFRRAVADEFGDRYGNALVRDLVLGELGELTGEQAIAAGVPVRKIWLALCREMDVPPERRHGAGLRRPGDADSDGVGGDTPDDSSRTFVR